MKVQELVAIMMDKKMSVLNPDQVQAKLAKELEVKDYLSIKKKKALVSDIVNTSIYYEDGIYKFDGIEKYIIFTMMTIAAYTNIELSNDLEEDYDALCQAGILDKVIATFDEEYQSVQILLSMKCDYILSSNTIEAKVGNFLDSVLEKIENVSDKLVNKAQEFDINNLNVTSDDIAKIQEFLGLLK